MNYHSGIKAIIFDFDGLIINSEPSWQKADTEFLAQRGVQYDRKTREQVRGMGTKEIIEIFKKKYRLEGSVEDLTEERMSLAYKIVLAELSGMEGVEALIKSLHRDGFVLALATAGNIRDRAEAILAKLHIRQYFSLIQGNDSVKRGKPNPDIYIMTAQTLAIEPSECLVLEDAPNGVLSGKAAGMTVYGVNKDAAIRKKLKEAGADKIFASLENIEL